MPKRPTVTDEFRRKATNYDIRWSDRWSEHRDGDSPTYDEVMAHLLRLKEMQLDAARWMIKEKKTEFHEYFYREGDEDAPFYSEACLYNLFGKDDARSILATMQTTIRMLEALLGKRFPMEIVY